ncbi:hypothetical protein DK801_22870 [Escherichia coli]|nr:hypothetical protein [Escherichia coli]EFO4030047.1 hypothetical protein [Escherichia coli]EHD1200065.1 hypothetical protein [Escherichia coli]EJD4432699.1 hypothetical protein [Escherichia coli]EKP4643751.1 hypothetical protein [Escherichia coli]
MTITEADMLEMIRSIAGIKQPASKINRCSAPVSVVPQQERHQQLPGSDKRKAPDGKEGLLIVKNY